MSTYTRFLPPSSFVVGCGGGQKRAAELQNAPGVEADADAEQLRAGHEGNARGGGAAVTEVPGPVTRFFEDGKIEARRILHTGFTVL